MDTSQEYELIQPERPCSRCRQVFTPRRRDQQYCSRACKEDAHRHRKTGMVAGIASPPEKVDLHFLAGLLDENPHWAFDLGVSPHSGPAHQPEWIRTGHPAHQFIPLLNQMLQKFRPACVYVRTQPEGGPARTYQLSLNLTSGQGLQGLGSPQPYPLPLSGPQETPESASLRVSLREKEVRLEHIEKELKEKTEKLETLTETHRRLRRAYRRWQEHVEAVDAENKEYEEELAKYKEKEKKVGEFLSSEKGRITKAIVTQGLEEAGQKLIGQVLSGNLGSGLGQPDSSLKPQLQKLLQKLANWDNDNLNYLNYLIHQVTVHPSLWEAVRQLIPPPPPNAPHQQERPKPKVSFEPLDNQ